MVADRAYAGQGIWAPCARPPGIGSCPFRRERPCSSLLNLAMTWGRVFPSLVGIAKRGGFCCKQTVVRFLAVLEALGFVTKHRRIQTIDTRAGRKTCQAANAYEVHQPKDGSLGAKILQSLRPSSESTDKPAKGVESEIPISPTPKLSCFRESFLSPRPTHRDLPAWFTQFRASLPP
jgi:hypothetical protein